MYVKDQKKGSKGKYGIREKLFLHRLIKQS